MYNYSEMLDSITTSSGSKVTIENKGYIGKIVTGEGSYTVIDNNGEIGTINTGIGSTTIISNSGEIGIINTGKESHTSIENKKESKIREIETGDSNKDRKTRTYIENSGTIDKIITGIESENYIEDYGTIKGVTTGKGNNTYYSSKNGIEFTKGDKSQVKEMTIKEMQNLKATIGIEYISPMILSTEYINRYIIGNKIDPNSIQAQALYRINEYSRNLEIQENISGVNIFFFEGAGSYNNKNYRQHPDGRYGAMVIVVKDGKIDFMSLNASTLPDSPNNEGIATIMDGVYDIVGGLHKNQNYDVEGVPVLRTSDGGIYQMSHKVMTKGKLKIVKHYPALWVNNNNAVDAMRDGKRRTAGGIHIHKGPELNESGSVYSEGCILVNPAEYGAFAQTVGFVKDPNKVSPGDPVYTITGQVIVDRYFMK